MITSESREKISVAMAEAIESAPKATTLISRVADVAKNDALSDATIYVAMLFHKEVFSVYSSSLAYATMPRVARADSHSARSKTANGMNSKIKKTETPKEVMESFVLPSKNRAV